MTNEGGELVEVARAEDVPEGRGLRVQVGPIEIGIFRADTSFFAIENACPHAGVALSEGTVERCVVTCPAHGFQYDLRTGHSVDGADGFPIPRFAIVERHGGLWIETELHDDGLRRPRPLRRVPPQRSA